MGAEILSLHQEDVTEPADVFAARLYLEGRGLPPDRVAWWLNEAGVRWEHSRKIGPRFGAKADGVLIPFFDLDGNRVMIDGSRPYERVRLTAGANGSEAPLNAGKYRSEPGTGLHAYLPPLPMGQRWRDVFNDTSIPIAITEGEFKAGEVTHYKLGGIPTIGLIGVDGLASFKQGVCPELISLKLHERAVTIIFDAPMHGRLCASIQRSVNWLTAMGARVKVACIDSTPIYQEMLSALAEDEPPPKMGVDDFIAAGGNFFNLLKDASDTLDEIGLTPDQSDEQMNELLSSIAIICGPSDPVYVHLDGKFRGGLRKKSGMAATLSDKTIAVPTRGGYVQKPAFSLWEQSRRRVCLRDVVVRPDMPPHSIVEGDNWNAWPGMVTVPKRNEALAKFYRDFLDKFFEHEIESPETVQEHKKRFIQWCAHIFQFPGAGKDRITSWTFKSDQEGIGKSVLLELIANIIGTGPRGGAFIADSSNLESEWTSFYYGRIFILFNEPSDDNKKMRQKAKNLRTQPTLQCNTKYGACIEIENQITAGFTTNEPYAFGISEIARRDWFWEVKWQQSDSAWIKLAAKFGWLACGDDPECDEFRAAVMWELMYEVDLSDYNPRDPAGNSRAKSRAATASTDKLRIYRDDLLQQIFDDLGDAPAIAWNTESWMRYSGSRDKKDASTDKQWLSSEMEKRGLHSGSVVIEIGKAAEGLKPGKSRVWFVSKELWSALTIAEKKAAIERGAGCTPEID